MDRNGGPLRSYLTGEERAEVQDDPVSMRTGALASKAKRDEMARQMKDLRATKFGINSGTYNKLLAAAEALQKDMETLAKGNLPEIERSTLMSKIEKETGTMKTLGEKYVADRGKGEPHPNFSSKWGERRFYSARSLVHLAEKMEEDLALVREKLRPDRTREESAQKSVQQGGGAAQTHEKHNENVHDISMNELGNKLNLNTDPEKIPEDFTKKRQDLAPEQYEQHKEQEQLSNNIS